MVLSNLNQICWKFQAKEFSIKTADFKYQKKKLSIPRPRNWLQKSLAILPECIPEVGGFF